MCVYYACICVYIYSTHQKEAFLQKHHDYKVPELATVMSEIFVGFY